MNYLLPADCPSNDCLEVGSLLLTATPEGLAALRRLHAVALAFMAAHSEGSGHVSMVLPPGVTFTAHHDDHEDQDLMEANDPAHPLAGVPEGFEPAGAPYRTELHRFDVFGGGTCYLTASPRDRVAYRIEADVQGLLFGTDAAGTPVAAAAVAAEVTRRTATPLLLD